MSVIDNSDSVIDVYPDHDVYINIGNIREGSKRGRIKEGGFRGLRISFVHLKLNEMTEKETKRKSI